MEPWNYFTLHGDTIHLLEPQEDEVATCSAFVSSHLQVTIVIGIKTFNVSKLLLLSKSGYRLNLHERPPGPVVAFGTVIPKVMVSNPTAPGELL
jgi:hypothetical protein